VLRPMTRMGDAETPMNRSRNGILQSELRNARKAHTQKAPYNQIKRNSKLPFLEPMTPNRDSQCHCLVIALSWELK
jgi:hypothetical protein